MAPQRFLILVLAASLTACGARVVVDASELDAGPPPSDAAAEGGEERICPPECAVGHDCCAGGCDGPVVPMPSDCCTCLSGEISSTNCDNHCGASP